MRTRDAGPFGGISRHTQFYIDDVTPTSSVNAESHPEAEHSVSEGELSRSDIDCASAEADTASSKGVKRAGETSLEY